MSADARRAELLQAALRVMSRDGVAAGTTRAIVAEAGMPLATFHYCFRSRNELLRDLITLVTTMERDVAAAAMTGEPPAGPATAGEPSTAADRPVMPDADFRETLRQGLRAYLDRVLGPAPRGSASPAT
jgi:AcrR family transcriptional regulator